MSTIDEKIGFIGAGNMAEAIGAALVQKGIFDKSNISMSDINEERLSFVKGKYGIQTTTNSTDLVRENDIIVLSVKPQVMDKVLGDIRGSFETDKRKLFISIAAGITTEKIEEYLYRGLSDEQKELLPVVRVMPNTPCMVFSGMSAMGCNKNCNTKDVFITRVILESMGKVIQVDEKEIDAVTAMSGSGPAYVFYFIESMIKAGIDLGFSDDVAGLLTLETFKGAIKLLEESHDTPQKLRENVTSKGGTTEAALKVMETSNLKEIIAKAIKAAQQRSVELSG